jgi:outer membrane protein TolC
MKLLIYTLFIPLCAFAQPRQDSALVLTLEKAVDIAREQSPDALYYRHNFRSQYWNYIYYKANYLPSLSFTSSPNFNHIISSIPLEDGSYKYVQQNYTTVDGTFSLSQNIALTGGKLSLQTNIQRMDMLKDKTHSYKTNPISISYSQTLFGYNQLKWDRKIDPVKFEEAKRSYVENLEAVCRNVAQLFFSLANAQINLGMAKFNYAKADTLYTFAQRRYELGTATENDMLQLELKRLTEESNMLNAEIVVDEYMQNLRTYLGITEAIPIVVSVDNEVPNFLVDDQFALQLALDNSSNMLTANRSKLQQDSYVASAKAATGMTAGLNASFGLSQTSDVLEMAYRNPSNLQYVSLNISVPILDWGRKKGRVRLAESQRDMVYNREEQNISNFEQNVLKTVKQFNLQNGKLIIAAKADRLAERRNEIAYKLYLSEKSTYLELESSISEKDAAKRDYISALNTYWYLYYTLRYYTLYDFEKKIALTEDYEYLIK